jgi:hypothetical protein
MEWLVKAGLSYVMLIELVASDENEGVPCNSIQ